MGCIIRHHMFIAFLHAPAEARLYGGTRVFYVYNTKNISVRLLLEGEKGTTG